MGWFTKSERKATPKANIWTKCKGCNAHVPNEDWKTNLKVCPKCNFHDKLTASERIDMVLDSGSFNELDAAVGAVDSLGFVDAKGPYEDKIVEAGKLVKLNEAVVTGHGTITGRPVAIAVMDFRFMGGSLGSATGEKILRAANYAYEHAVPYILFSSSGGARMHEGTLSLMQMAKTCAGIGRLNTKKIPYICVLTDPTTGGVSASFAMVGDIHIAEPGALIGFAGRRVIEQTIKQKLPADFQTSEYLLAHGFVDMIVPRKDLRARLAALLAYTAGNPSEPS
jgi:acetyl-CoA carboxylase carboxyl transferase subunit beta